MNKQLEIGKKKILDTMSKVVTEEKLKVLADVIDREFGNLNQELDETSEKVMVIIAGLCYNLGVKRVMTS